MKKLMQQWEALWKEKHDQIAERLKAERTNLKPGVWIKRSPNSRIKLEKLKQKK